METRTGNKQTRRKQETREERGKGKITPWIVEPSTQESPTASSSSLTQLFFLEENETLGVEPRQRLTCLKVNVKMKRNWWLSEKESEIEKLAIVWDTNPVGTRWRRTYADSFKTGSLVSVSASERAQSNLDGINADVANQCIKPVGVLVESNPIRSGRLLHPIHQNPPPILFLFTVCLGVKIPVSYP